MSETSAQFIYTEELYKLAQKTIVLLPVSWETVSEDQVTLLEKILSAVRLSLAGVQIICREEADIHQLNVFNPSVIISFGTLLNPKVEPYTLHEIEGTRIIQSEALSKLNDANKKSLWSALKQAFA